MEYLILYERVQAYAWNFVKDAAGIGRNQNRIFSLAANGLIWKKDLKAKPKSAIRYDNIAALKLEPDGKKLEIKYVKKVGDRDKVILKVCKKGCSSKEDMRYLFQALKEKAFPGS